MWLVGCGPTVPTGDGGAEGSGGSSTEVSSISASEADDGRVDSSSSTGADACTSCDCAPTGTMLWRRTQPPAANERVLAQSLARLDDGRLVVAGRHSVFPDEDSHGEHSTWVGIFDREASLSASNTALGGANTADAFALGVATNGTRIAIAGYVNLVEGGTQPVLIVYDDALQPQWTVEQPQGLWNGVTFDSEGGVVAVGSATSASGASVAVVARFDSDGESMWRVETTGTDTSTRAYNTAAAVAQGDGRLWVVGSLDNLHDESNADVWTSGWTLDGTLAVELLYDSSTLPTYASSGYDRGEGVAISPAGDVLTVGSHYIRKDKPVGYITASERWARLVDRDGNERWRWWHDSPESHPGTAYGAAYDDCGNAFIVGKQEVTSNEDDQMFVAKLSPDGQTLWDVAAGDISSEIGVYEVVVDDDGTALVLTAETDDTVVLSRWSQ